MAATLHVDQLGGGHGCSGSGLGEKLSWKNSVLQVPEISHWQTSRKNTWVEETGRDGEGDTHTAFSRCASACVHVLTLMCVHVLMCACACV